jgi:hypothetical protein
MKIIDIRRSKRKHEYATNHHFPHRKALNHARTTTDRVH